MTERPRPKDVGHWGQLAAVGPIFAGSVVVGYFLGRWVDRSLGSEPWCMLIGMSLGIAAGVREIIRVVRLSGARRGLRDRLKKAGAGAGTAGGPTAGSQPTTGEAEQGRQQEGPVTGSPGS
jgi:hypothetical protein